MYNKRVGTVYRFKANLTGFIGGPGVNTWHMCQIGEIGGADQSDLEGMASDIAAVYTAVKAHLVNSVRVNIDPVVEGFDIATGNLESVHGIAAPAEVAGTSATLTLSRATQVCVRLQTDALRGNRQVQGRHFLGPIGGSAFGADGQISSSVRTLIQNAYGGVTDVLGDARLVVWAQRNDKMERPDARAGRIGYVQSVIANATPGTLRSRKE